MSTYEHCIIGLQRPIITTEPTFYKDVDFTDNGDYAYT